MTAGYHSSEVRNLAKHSPVFRQQKWQRYRIKDTDKGPEVWEVKWVALHWLRRVAFGRCSIESCFRAGKEELGLDHYEVRGWRCVHRHFYVTQLSHLFCARVRQEYDQSPGDHVDWISIEQVRSATNVWLDAADLSPQARRQRFEDEQQKQQYYQRRNAQARKSHTKTRIEKLTNRTIRVGHLISPRRCSERRLWRSGTARRPFPT